MHTAPDLFELLRPLTEAPEQAAIFCDVDGTLAPITQNAQNARVSGKTASLLNQMALRYGCVACVSGRPAREARHVVGADRITYVGIHGAELLMPENPDPKPSASVGLWQKRLTGFVEGIDGDRLTSLGIRAEDKGPVYAFHWRGSHAEDDARSYLIELAAKAENAGLAPHFGRKVMELRPPDNFDKGIAVADLVRACKSQTALYAGDDTTDLDAFQALAGLESRGLISRAVLIGVGSQEGPAEICERANLVVDGVSGFNRVLAALANF